MAISDIIASAGKNLHTIIIKAEEADGSIEVREAEPYSYRVKKDKEYFYCYDIKRQGIRCFMVSRIISVRETNNTFDPRWNVEV